MQKSSGYISSWLAPAVPVAAFLAITLWTAPGYIADTARFAHDVALHAEGKPGQFYEFGHLLWRPWGYAGLATVGGMFERAFGDTPQEAVIRFLMATAWISAGAALLLCYGVLRAAGPRWAAVAGTLALLFANPFLNYSRSGAPYIPALCFLWLTLYWLVRGGTGRAAAAGVSFAVSFGLWFPFSLAAPGAVALVLAEKPGRRGRTLASFCGAAALAAGAAFALGAWGYGVQDGNGLTRWVHESKNDWQQNLTAVRVATGLPRSIYDLGADGVLLKRRFFRDPYSPVSAAAVIPVLLKVGWFFLTAGLVAASLVRAREWRRVAAVVLAGTLPLLFFAVFLFEPGSPERFLPAFPFFFLACATVWSGWPRYRAAALAAGVLFASAAVSNTWALNGYTGTQRKEAVVGRKAAIGAHTEAGRGVIFVATIRDDFYRLAGSRPLDRDLAMPGWQIIEAVEPASAGLPFWRARAAGLALEAWKEGGEVWVSDRLLAARPEPAWEWVEGDDRRVRWRDLPEFFGTLETERPASVPPDGFTRLLPTESNRTRLEAAVQGRASGGTQ